MGPVKLLGQEDKTKGKCVGASSPNRIFWEGQRGFESQELLESKVLPGARVVKSYTTFSSETFYVGIDYKVEGPNLKFFSFGSTSQYVGER